MAKAGSKGSSSASKQITAQIAAVKDWRGELLARLRKLVLEAAPGITEEVKWGTPVWTKNGIVVSVGAFKEHVKLNFFKGASLKDPKKLFNAGLGAKGSRSIDFRKGDKVDPAALKALVREAVALDVVKSKKK